MNMVADVTGKPVKPRSCANTDGSPKVHYATRALAKQVARRVSRDGARVVAYRCPSGCEGFHVGHPTPDPAPAPLGRPGVFYNSRLVAPCGACVDTDLPVAAVLHPERRIVDEEPVWRVRFVHERCRLPMDVVLARNFARVLGL